MNVNALIPGCLCLLVLAAPLFAGLALASSAPADAPQASIAPQASVATKIPPQPLIIGRPLTGDEPAPLAPDAAGVTLSSPGQSGVEDYRMGPQDLVEVQVYGLEGLKREVRVNSRGVITLPLIGTVALGGLTAQEGEMLITAKYEKDYLRNPQVSLFIKEFTSQRITIDGAVVRPGVFPIKGQTSLL